MRKPMEKTGGIWRVPKGSNIDFKRLTNQQLLFYWLGRHKLSRKWRLALKKEMRVRRVTTGGFLEI